MANLIQREDEESESLTVSDYSESFELDSSTTESSLSDGQGAVVKMKKSLLQSVQSDHSNAISHHRPPLHEHNMRSPVIQKPSNHRESEVDLGRTIRSPMTMAYHLNKNDDLDSTGGSTADTSLDLSTTSSNPVGKPFRFKNVAGSIQTMQSTIKSFKSADQVRDVAFKEWLTKKEVQKLQEKSSQMRDKEIEAEKKKQKELEFSQQCVKAMEKWTASKQDKLESKRKQKANEARKKSKEARDKQNKVLEAEKVADKWRKEKHKQLVKEHREQKKKKKEEKRRKEEEGAEKQQESKQAFQSWCQHKDSTIKKEIEIKKKQTKELQQTQEQKTSQRESESKKIFEAWKALKEEKLKTDRTQFTYKNPKKIHERSWCPSRSMQYDYPKSTETMSSKKTTALKSEEADSYSTASFESEDELSYSSSFSSEDGSASSSIQDSVGTSTPKGKRKTIQVCCQTLQYWCTCDDTTS